MNQVVLGHQLMQLSRIVVKSREETLELITTLTVSCGVVFERQDRERAKAV